MVSTLRVISTSMFIAIPSTRRAPCAILAALLAVAAAPVPAGADTFRATIGNGQSWTFVNGAWTDVAAGELAVPKTLRLQDGPGMQAHHYAFLKTRSYRDLKANF